MAKDIYFEKNYGKLYEHIENGRADVFEYKDENGKISTQFIIREVPIKIDKNTIYYDIVTPYGYGGPLIEECIGDKEKLVSNFEKAFEQYCKENNVVSEFVRFHPLLNNAKDLKKIYDVQYLRNTVGTNLKDYEDPIKEEFTKNCRKKIKKIINKGINYKITVEPENLQSFKDIYYETMKRNNATDYYFFEDEYFENLLKYFKKNIVLIEAIYNNQVIACGLYFIYNKTIHIHLTGTLNGYLHFAPEYILRYAITLWGKENGYEIIHNGGGRSNAEDDSLYLFKKQFGVNTQFDFYIGKKIWNQEIYDKLCNHKKIGKDEEFFPAYRREK